jgi:hypothetical protein
MLRQTQETAFSGAAFTFRTLGAEGTATMREVAALTEDAVAVG